MRNPVYYWPGVGNRRNFGDFVTELLLDELFYPLPVRARGIHLIGSCIDDMFVSDPAGATVELDQRIVFWGCGLRTANGLSESRRSACEVLAVRGPLTRSALRLGAAVPMGDPALLLPALHAPVADPSTAGRSVCIPHYHDQRSDAELLEMSGCDVVLRPNLPDSKHSIRRFVDQLASADFVLSAALHGAIVAAAYGRPFAFWDNGHLDLPFKWEDFAASVGIENRFARDLRSGRELYERHVAESLRLPPLWPLLAAAPLVVRVDGALAVLAHEARAEKGSRKLDLARKLAELRDGQQVVGELSGHGTVSGAWGAAAVASLHRWLEEAEARRAELERELQRQGEGFRAQLGTSRAQLETARTELESSRSELETSRSQLESSRAQLEASDAKRRELDALLVVRTAEIVRLEGELKKLAPPEARVSSLEPATALELHKRAVTYQRRRAPAAPRKVGLGSLKVPLTREALKAVLTLRSRDAFLLAGTPLLDCAWYLSQYPDLAAARVNPIVHYYRFGAAEGRDPGPLFDTDWYLKQNPDVAAAGVNPLCHYLRTGHVEGRYPNALFAPRWYLREYPDVEKAGIEPLTHYLLFGAAEGRHPHPGFDPAMYVEQHPDVAASGMNPLAHRLRTPQAEPPKTERMGSGKAEPAALPAPAPARREVVLGRSVRNRGGPRILIVDSVYPRPDRDSGSVTARYLVDILLGLGWQVSFYADAEADDGAPYAQELDRAGVRCLYRSEYADLEAFLQAEGSSISLAMLFRVSSGGRHYEAVRRHCPQAKVVFETVDLHFLREERQARLEGDRRALNVAYATRERELYVARSSDVAIVVSDYEHQLLEREVPGVRAMTLPLILDCPGRRTPFAQRKGIAFVGGYLHQPNIDAVNHFLDEIWPKVVAEMPSAVFHIVGADLPASLQKRASGNVVAVGYVKDIDAFLDTMRLTVAPLRYGAGVKGKVGSSLANGVPCVASPVAVEGMGIGPGQGVVVASEPAEYARALASLHEDEVAWTRLSDGGWKFAAHEYSLDAARRRISAMLRRLELPAGPASAEVA